MMLTVSEAQALVHGLTEQEFLAQHPSPVIMLDRSMPPVTAHGTGVHTAAYDVVPAFSGPVETGVFTLARPDGKTTLPVSIGRTKSCDVVLDSPSVSKLHAFVQLSAAGAGYFLTDNKSSKGTWINGTKLEPNQPAILANEDTVDFAHVFCGQYYEALALYRRLRAT